MATASQDSSSSSRRHFHWTKQVRSEEEEAPSLNYSSSNNPVQDEKTEKHKGLSSAEKAQGRKLPASMSVSRLRSAVLTAFGKKKCRPQLGLGTRVVGTLFGSRNGHVHFAFQREPNSKPALLVELATPISGLVKEMASGLVRIALECDRRKEEREQKAAVRLLEEPAWRTFCNGKKCGFATSRECGDKEWKILKALAPISMGAGVLPGKNNDEGQEKAGSSESEVIYMRAKFERIVGSRDSEAFYMMNPDSNGAPELSVYLLRV